MTTIRKFPSVPDTMQDAARLAHSHLLTLTYFNSGSRYNSRNGWRIYAGRGRDFFDDETKQRPFLVHYKTATEIKAFLAGYRIAINGTAN